MVEPSLLVGQRVAHLQVKREVHHAHLGARGLDLADELLHRGLVGSPGGGKGKVQTFDAAEWLPYLRLEAWRR